ncbi:MAG: hypothetical protein ACI4TP_01055 [Anaerotignum sp.]
MSSSGGKVIHYIQQKLYEGRQPDKAGYYVFPRKELSEGAEISATTFDNCKDDVVSYFEKWCDLKVWAKYNEYAGEILYVDVSYQRGKLRFRQNPITINSQLSHLWALPPLDSYFSYDCFDDKHRRRINGSSAKMGAIPWAWDADIYEEVCQNGDNEKLAMLMENANDSSLVMKQAKEIYAEFDIALLMLGYPSKNIARVLYGAVRNTLPELCDFVLQHGADPNEIMQKSNQSASCLFGLGKQGADWEKVVRLLIDAGCELTCGGSSVSSFAGDIFSNASDELCIYYVEALQKAGQLDYHSDTGWSPLSIAVKYKGEDHLITRMMKEKLQNSR